LGKQFPETDISQSHTTYTCGEDGFIRAWKPAVEEEGMDIDDTGKTGMKKASGNTIKEKKEKRKEKKEKKRAEGDRFKPY
jgi:WD repeat-containing protein 89